MTVTPFKLSPEVIRSMAERDALLPRSESSSHVDQTRWNRDADARITDNERRSDKAKTWKDRIYDANTLSAKTFDPVRWMLPGIIPEGVTILAGKPKIGKSWLALDICIAAADGSRYTLGDLKPRHGDCLYLALEDNERRMKKRIDKLMPPDWVWPDRLDIAHEWRRADQGGIDDLRAWCNQVKQDGGYPGLIQIDTLQKFRPVAKGSETYGSDYAAVSALLSLTKEFPGLCIIVVHHDRKMAADDPFDTVSGTLGITGAADTIMIIKRDAGGVKLYVRGRDVEDSEIPLRFEKASCKWTRLNAEDAEDAISAERQTIIDALAEFPAGLSLKDIAAATGREETPGLRKMLFDMTRSGQVRRISRGVYGPCGIESNIGNEVTSNSQTVEATQESPVVTLVTDVTEGAHSRAETDDPAEWSEARLNVEMPLLAEDQFAFGTSRSGRHEHPR
jgi:hypothetical protein